MIRDAVPESASGLRPASAYFVVAAVLCVVAGWVAWIALGGKAWLGFRPTREQDPAPEYTICDRSGKPLAAFVQRLDLTLSPRAMWQAHTPETIVLGLARAFGAGTSAQKLLERMLPDAKQGCVRASFELDATRARALDLFLRRGSHDPEAEPNPIRGMWIERAKSKSATERFTLVWQPLVALSAPVRESHLNRQKKNPLRWSRELADGIAQALDGEHALRAGRDDEDELAKQRARIWEGLMPTRYVAAVPDFDATRAPEVWAFLNEEHVASHQMSIERGRNRRYPLGPMRVLGGWGFIDKNEAERRALDAFGVESALIANAAGRSALIASLSPDDRQQLDLATWKQLAEPEAIVGLELVCDQLLRGDAWKALEREAASFEFFRNRPIRQVARGQGSQARSYYMDSRPASDTPRVVTTIDARLQVEVGRQLETVMQKSKPALAMALVLDVETGDVLAVDSREAYAFGGFAPTTHSYTPGSTGKVLVMASAIEAGVVGPTSRIDVGHGEYRIPGTHRLIHEAERPGRSGVISAAECLAFSLNAGLVQIGLRLAPEVLRGDLRKLHYAEFPGSGFPGERPGMLPELKYWTKADAWASVCFGHGYMTTMWQHAAGLAAVVRGGEWKPLRLIDRVEQGTAQWTLPRARGERVYSAATCETVREMMMLGAREGTGKIVASPEKMPGAIVGTKTGTAQKVSTEVCLHVELEHQAKHAKQGTKCSKSCRAALKGAKKGHGDCYTSSMVIFGRRESGGRELMVYVVVDDKTAGERYGSAAAGPAATAILREALGLTANAEPLLQVDPNGFVPSSIAPRPEHGVHSLPRVEATAR
ncbi:MAG TPA: penicillin-binding transpeptidase domain-containing protein [Planctomycetota bacterium]|nr:penicillin-binding transpeptidase domain-containing protein [Planctomycetota bacterium]